MFDNLNLVFSPLLPFWLIISLCVAVTLFCLLGLIKNMRGSLVRALAGALLCLALFNPSLLQEERSDLSNIVALVIDETTSQKPVSYTHLTLPTTPYV